MAGDDNWDKRYDCFISFPGSQKLSDLGFRGQDLECTVRDLASEVNKRLGYFPRHPNVFYDQKEIEDHWPDYLSNAILQLRGGGVALVLLTADYLNREYCLAELRAFLHLERLRTVDGRKSEAVHIIVVNLELDERAVPNALQDDALKNFFRFDLSTIDFQQLPVPKRSTRPLAVDWICSLVQNYWHRERQICLGGEIGVCLDYLATRFSASSCSDIIHKLDLESLEIPERNFGNVKSIFRVALANGRFSPGSADLYLSDLSDTADHSGVNASRALKAFRQKWSSGAWLWSIARGENDICLQSFITEAVDALYNRRPLAGPSGAGGASTAGGGERRERAGDVSGSMDKFRPYWPPWSNFDSVLVPSAATSLSQLKVEILPAADVCGGQQRIAGEAPSDILNQAISGGAANGPGLRRVALISISGEGGVGKTSACKLLCADGEVRAYFASGAILWIDVGRNAKEEKVIGELRKAVSNCGGKIAAKDIQKMSCVSEAVDRAREFFEGRRLLVVIDNVWQTPADSRVKSWTAVLSRITDSPESGIIMTTRSENLADSPGFHSVRIGPLNLSTAGDLSIAKDLYDTLVKEPPESRRSRAYEELRKKALQLSFGHLLAISSIAALVRHGIIKKDAAAVLSSIGRSINLASRPKGKDLEDTVGHPGLFYAMTECLEFLDKHKGSVFCSKSMPPRSTEDGENCSAVSASYDSFPGRAFSARYFALHFLQASSPRLPFSLLRRVWHLTEEDADEVATELVDIGLARVEDGEERVFVLHNLQYDFCSRRCDPSSRDAFVASGADDVGVVNGHLLFLSSCESDLFSRYRWNDSGMWTQICFGDAIDSRDQSLRDYLPFNLLRHFCSAALALFSGGSGKDTPAFRALYREIVHVLSDCGWLRGRLAASGSRSSVQRDFYCAFQARFLTKSDDADLRALAICLSRLRLSGASDGTFASHLVQLAQSPSGLGDFAVDAGLLERLAKQAEKEIRGVWLKSISGCSRTREVVLAKSRVNTCGVVSMAALGDGASFVAMGGDGAVQIVDAVDLESLLVLRDRFSCLAVQPLSLGGTSFFIFVGNASGHVFCFEIQLDSTGGGVEKSRFEVGHCDCAIRCLHVSKDGALVAAGNEDGRVIIWEREDEGACNYGLVVNFLCEVAGSESSYVERVQVSESGRLVVACSSTGALAFWRRTKDDCGGKVQIRSVSAERGSRFIFLSEDEGALIVVFPRPAGYEVWNVGEAQLRLRRADLPGVHSISSAAFVFEGNTCGASKATLLVGGLNDQGRRSVAEYSVGDKLEVTGKCLISYEPSSICNAFFGGEIGERRIVVGVWSDVHLLDISAFEAGGAEGIVMSDAAKKDEGEGGLEKLGMVTAVAVMPESGLVVAGHRSGGLSSWSAEDGTLKRVVEGQTSRLRCIDVSGDESVAVGGTEDGKVVVWETSTWKCKLTLEGHAAGLEFVSISADAKRVVSVDIHGELRVWDAEIGGATLLVVDTDVELYDNPDCRISAGGEFFLWATTKKRSGPCDGKVIDLAAGKVVFESELHSDWRNLLREASSSVAGVGQIHSWKPPVSLHTGKCELRDADSGQDGACWQIAAVGGQLECAWRPWDGQDFEKVSLDFGRIVFTVAAAWLSPAGEDGRRRAIVACKLEDKPAPAILHLVIPKL